MSNKKAVVLLSGGLDSTTCMSVAHKEGYEIYPISFDYGQRHIRELTCVKEIVAYYNVKGKVFKLDSLGGSSLTDREMKIPSYKGESEAIPTTYVPARNIIFLSHALGYAEVIEAEAIFIGVSSVDYSGYPDCRPEFIEAFQNVINTGTKFGVEGKAVKIITPLINLSKSETIKLAAKNNAPLHLTTSCYKGKEIACGECDSCMLRLKGFAAAGIKDPIPYEK